MLQMKVSVIVPIYKVEKYLHRCIKSITNQTYQNIEIILVNDGSPDLCGEIVDQYGAIDPRIKVIHKENGGLSDARNAGMKEVTGEYVMYVDSDDWINEKMVEVLMDALQNYEADLVQSSFYYTYEQYNLYDNRYYKEDAPPVILDNESLMYELVVNERVKNFAWGKLYKTELIRDLPFRKDVLFEDVFWAHNVMQRVKRFVLLHEPLYNYLQREDSIVATYSLKNLDQIQGLKERHQFIEKFYHSLSKDSYKTLLKTCLTHYNLLLISKAHRKEKLYRKEIQVYIKNNYKIFKNSVGNDKELKRQLHLFALYPPINVLYLFIIKVLRKVRIISRTDGLKQINHVK